MREWGDKSHRTLYVKIRKGMLEEEKSEDTVGGVWFKLIL